MDKAFACHPADRGLIPLSSNCFFLLSGIGIRKKRSRHNGLRDLEYSVYIKNPRHAIFGEVKCSKCSIFHTLHWLLYKLTLSPALLVFVILRFSRCSKSAISSQRSSRPNCWLRMILKKRLRTTELFLSANFYLFKFLTHQVEYFWQK